jgi:biotin carboxylase
VVELVFMMLILKLPIVYLVGVCWWAIRQEPDPLEGAALRARIHGEGPRRWQPKPGRRPVRGGPHGRGVRTTRVKA